MADIELKVEAEVSDAIRDLLALVRTKKKVAQEANVVQRATDDMGKSWGRAAQNMFAFVGTTGALYAGINVIRQMGAELDKISDKIKELGQSESTRTLGMAGVSEDRRKQVAGLAAEYGIKPKEADDAHLLFHEQNKGDAKKVDQGIRNVGLLTQAGVDPQAAQNALYNFQNFGFDYDQGGALLAAAGATSKYGPKDIAASSSAMLAYQDKLSGLSVLTSLSNTSLGPGELEVFTRQAANAVGLNEKSGQKLAKLAKKRGFQEHFGVTYEDATEAQRLSFARAMIESETGGLSGEHIGKFGITEERQNKALSALFDKDIWKYMGDSKAAFQKAMSGETTLQGYVNTYRSTDDSMNRSIESDIAEAKAEHGLIYGPAGDAANRRDDRLRRQGEPLIGTSAQPYMLDDRGRLAGVPAMFSDLSEIFRPPNMAYEEEKYRGKTTLSRDEWEDSQRRAANPPTDPQMEQNNALLESANEQLKKLPGEIAAAIQGATPAPATRQPNRNASEGQ